MVKRKKRLEKGIESLEKQIKLHEGKQKIALEKDKIFLGEYYSREISAKEEDKKRRERILNRKK